MESNEREKHIEELLLSVGSDRPWIARALRSYIDGLRQERDLAANEAANIAARDARAVGVRLGIEAAAKVCIHEGDEAAIRALDAEKIARE